MAGDSHDRVRLDGVDKITLRHHGGLHSIGMGRTDTMWVRPSTMS